MTGTQHSDSFTIPPMKGWRRLKSLAKSRPWLAELLVAVLGVIIGVALMPALIFYAGSQALGLYEGATLGHLYSSLLQGIKEASIAAWIVVLGPYGLYVLFRLLKMWWRNSAKLA